MSFLDRFRRAGGRKCRNVGPTEAAEMLHDGALLIDVRERSEFSAGHAPKARHVPLGQLLDRGTRVPQGRTLVLVCRSGARSRRAAQLLAHEGFDVVNLAGGMNAWARAGLALVRTGGGQGRVA